MEKQGCLATQESLVTRQVSLYSKMHMYSAHSNQCCQVTLSSKSSEFLQYINRVCLDLMDCLESRERV